MSGLPKVFPPRTRGWQSTPAQPLPPSQPHQSRSSPPEPTCPPHESPGSRRLPRRRCPPGHTISGRSMCRQRLRSRSSAKSPVFPYSSPWMAATSAPVWKSGWRYARTEQACASIPGNAAHLRPSGCHVTASDPMPEQAERNLRPVLGSTGVSRDTLMPPR